jgi:hypothetical protein
VGSASAPLLALPLRKLPRSPWMKPFSGMRARDDCRTVLERHMMRLIDVETLELRQFQHRDIPPYAILSHTWGKEEVSFADFTSSTSDKGRHHEGYNKIAGCCRKAKSEGYSWVWMDTCCIDKSSSAELSEAINSMFKWYEAADVCYAWLSDVESSEDPRHISSGFRRSKWWTRGWTLQELLAPAEVVFLARDWIEIGTKEVLQDIVSEMSGISEFHLADDEQDGWRRASVAQKLSWAARRFTTRPEDESYCLMGLFDINMPLLYGEGSTAAFRRLQHHILQSTDDQSILAWRPSARDSVTDFALMGLLALSPRNFARSGGVEKYPLGTSIPQHQVSGAVRGYDDPPCHVVASRLLISALVFKFPEYNRHNPHLRYSPREIIPLSVMLHEIHELHPAAQEDPNAEPTATEAFTPLLMVLNCSVNGTRDRAPLGLVIIPGRDTGGAYVRAHCRFIACVRLLERRVANTTIHCMQQFQFKLDTPRNMMAGSSPVILLRYTPSQNHPYQLIGTYPRDLRVSSKLPAAVHGSQQISVSLRDLPSSDRLPSKRPRIAYFTFTVTQLPGPSSFGLLLYQNQAAAQLWVGIGDCTAGGDETRFYELVERLNASRTQEDKVRALQEPGGLAMSHKTCITISKMLTYQLVPEVAIVVRLRKFRSGEELASMRDVLCVTLENTPKIDDGTSE